MGKNGVKLITAKHQIKYGERTILTLNGVCWDDNNDDLNMEFIHENDLIFSNCMKPMQLILHDLSDLTKPIKVEGYNDGKEFIPMVELFQMIYTDELIEMFNNFNGYKLGCNKENDCYYMIFDNYDFDGVHTKAEYEVQFYYKNGCLVLDVPVWMDNVIENNYSLYQKLFEWKFDVFELIPGGLAIDVNTIK